MRLHSQTYPSSEGWVGAGGFPSELAGTLAWLADSSCLLAEDSSLSHNGVWSPKVNILTESEKERQRDREREPGGSCIFFMT